MEWNKVNEKKPSDGELVLTCRHSKSTRGKSTTWGIMTLRYRKDGDKYMCTKLHNQQYPTHWVNLPKLPQ